MAIEIILIVIIITVVIIIINFIVIIIVIMVMALPFCLGMLGTAAAQHEATQTKDHQ